MADCGCSGKTRIMYACSGAADVGEIADTAVRKLRSDGYGKMTCLAAIGAGLSGYIESAKAADENLAIDGCPVGCAKKILEQKGIAFRSVVLTELGLEKGKTPATTEVVSTVCDKITGNALTAQPSGSTKCSGGCCG